MTDLKELGNSILDPYALKARLAPVMVVLLPPVLTMAAFFPRELLGWDLVAWFGSSLLLAVFLEQLARDGGKRREKVLWEEWGGEPSASLLRHNSNELSRELHRAYRSNLEHLVGVELPSPDQERNDPEAADEQYLRCTAWLRAHTRDNDRFKLLHEELRNYGFRRNLYGMRATAGILLSLALAILLIHNIPSNINPWFWPPVSKVALIVELGLIYVWRFLVAKEWVKVPANAYAHRLLEASDVLVKNLN